MANINQQQETKQYDTSEEKQPNSYVHRLRKAFVTSKTVTQSLLPVLFPSNQTSAAAPKVDQWKSTEEMHDKNYDFQPAYSLSQLADQEIIRNLDLQLPRLAARQISMNHNSNQHDLSDEESGIFPPNLDPFQKEPLMKSPKSHNIGIEMDRSSSAFDFDQGGNQTVKDVGTFTDSSDEDPSELLAYEPQQHDCIEYNSNLQKNTRTHILKSEPLTALLINLHIQKPIWSTRFKNKVAKKLDLEPIQLYKWRWERIRAESRQLTKLRSMNMYPDRIFYITKVKRRKLKQKPKNVQLKRLT